MYGTKTENWQMKEVIMKGNKQCY